MRKMATVRSIDKIEPIEGADAIEVAVIGGWKVVVKKGEYKEKDLAVYCEIDSWIPTDLAPFLSKGKEPREYLGVKGEKLRTIKLRGQVSQGLLLPLPPRTMIDDEFLEDDDVSELLNIVKYDPPMNAQLAGMAKGNFPSFIPKTDQERVQNVKSITPGTTFEVTEKLEGSSMTAYFTSIQGEFTFGVCSRNLDLKESEGNAFWEAARAYNLESKLQALSSFTGMEIALQGELVGEGIQGNIYNIKGREFYIYDVFDIKGQCYLSPEDRSEVVENILGLNSVPVLDIALEFTNDNFCTAALHLADGKSKLADTNREGLVFKANGSPFSFKAISNKYLLKQA